MYTQETDWGDQGEMMWKQIVRDGGLEGIKKQSDGRRDKEIIECRRSTKHLKKRYPAGVETNNFFTEFEIKKQRYPSYMENDEYHLLNNKSAKDSVEKDLYQRMVKAAVKLNRIFPLVRGMTDDVCVLEASKQPTEEMRVDETGTWVTCLFDNGAEAGTHTQTLDNAVELEKLED